MRDMPAARWTLITLMVAAAIASPQPAWAIHGGAVVPADVGEAAAHFVSVGPSYKGGCSGVLVDPQVVLTAAHCVRRRDGRALKVHAVRLGNPRGTITRAAVAAIHVHPKYDPGRPEGGHDLAALVLAKPATGHTPIRLATAAEDAKPGTKVFVRGFGLIRKGRKLVSSAGTLREARVEALSPFSCFSGPVKEMAKTRACAAWPDAGVCPGDSGAGVVRLDGDEPVVVGIVSVVLDAGRCHSGPIIMARVSAFGDWLDSVPR